MAQSESLNERDPEPGGGTIPVQTVEVVEPDLSSVQGPTRHQTERQATPSKPWRQKPWFSHLLVLGGYLAVTVLVTWPLSVNLGTAIPGDSFDGWQNYWNLWWIRLALVDKITNPLFTDILYAPTGVSLYFHTLNPFNGVAALPVQLVFGLIPAYNAVVFVSSVLAGYGMFLLSRWIVGATAANLFGEVADRAPANARPNSAALHFVTPFLAGLVFAISPFHMAHLLGHMQVVSLEWIPFYVLLLLQSLQSSVKRQPWLRRAVLAGLFLVLTGLCDWYFVLYLFLFTSLATLWTWWHCARSSGAVNAFVASLRPGLTAGALFALLLSPWLIPMVQEATQYQFMVRPSTDLYSLSASVMDFLIPNRLHTLFRPASFQWIGNQVAPVSERTIAIGYVPLALALSTLLLARRKALFWWIVAVFFFLLALGPRWHLGNITADDIPAALLQVQNGDGWTPYALLNRLIPFMRISRSVSRFALMVQFAASVLSAIGLAAIWARVEARHTGDNRDERDPVTRRRFLDNRLLALSAVCVVVVLAEYWVAPYPLSPPDTPAYYELLAKEADDRAVLNLPMNFDRPGYLLYQTVHGKPLSVAYISRDDPRTLTERAPVLQHFRHLGPDILDLDPATVGLTVLHDLGVGTVVLDRYKMPGGLERTYTEELAAQIFAGELPTYADDRLTVYEVAPEVEPQPYLILGAENWGPLQQDSTGVGFRVLTGPARVHFAHVAPTMELQITYRTTDKTGLSIRGPDGNLLFEPLPAARDGSPVTLDLRTLADAQGTLPEYLELVPDVQGAVEIERLALDQVLS